MRARSCMLTNPEPAGASDCPGIKTDAVIANRKLEVATPAQQNRYVFRVGVPGDVVESLLGDAVHARGGLDGNRGKRVEHSKLDGNAFLLAELVA